MGSDTECARLRVFINKCVSMQAPRAYASFTEALAAPAPSGMGTAVPYLALFDRQDVQWATE